MSNALSVLEISATAPDTAPPPVLTITPLMTRLIAAGICVLVAWCAWRVLHPEKLALASAPGRRNRLTPMHILVLFVGWWVINSGLYWGLAEMMEAGSSRFKALWVLAAQPTMLILGIVTAAYTFPLGLRRGMGLSARHWLYDTVRAVLTYLAVLPICIGLLALSMWILPDSIQKQHGILRILGFSDLPNAWKAVVIFAAVVLGPLGEEIFYRGLVQSMLRRYTGSAWTAVIISSVIFAAMHSATPQAIVPLLALGIVLGYSYEHTGRLYRSILIHALFNGVAILDHLTKG